MLSEAADYDGAWKEALEHYLHPFLDLCFADIATRIDWRVPVEFLDQELQQVVRDAHLGKQRADKLVKVFRVDGAEEWLLIHVEVQSQRDCDLPLRMYQYHHRITDRFGRPVVGLAVLADAHPDWRPAVYEEDHWGCRLRFEYRLCKLLDFAPTVDQLAGGGNPAGVVVAAHLAAQATPGDPERRRERKWQLTRRLYERGYSKQEILDLYRLIDWLMVLPRELAVAFRRDLIQYETQKAMPYVTSIQQLGREEGREEGRQEGRQEGLLTGRQEDILEALATRFGAVPYELRERVQAIQEEGTLKRLLRQAVLAPSLEAFSAALQT